MLLAYFSFVIIKKIEAIVGAALQMTTTMLMMMTMKREREIGQCVLMSFMVETSLNKIKSTSERCFVSH